MYKYMTRTPLFVHISSWHQALIYEWEIELIIWGLLTVFLFCTQNKYLTTNMHFMWCCTLSLLILRMKYQVITSVIVDWTSCIFYYLEMTFLLSRTPFSHLSLKKENKLIAKQLHLINEWNRSIEKLARSKRFCW